MRGGADGGKDGGGFGMGEGEGDGDFCFGIAWIGIWEGVSE